jgi:pimeloyl-ACP methyl ester carboxylesterase
MAALLGDERSQMETVTSRDGTSIAFERIGTGSPLVLVEGALQDRAIDPRTARLAELLAAEFAVYHYDRRGRGDSADRAPYDVDREIDDLDALIAHAGEFAFVFGMSSGGVLAIRAAYAGVAIRRLALYEPPFIVDGSRAPLPADYLCALIELTAADRVTFEALAHTLPYDVAVMADTGRGNPPLLEQWSRLAVATLVLDGSESPLQWRNACDLLAEALPRSCRQTLDGQSHEVEPEVLAPVLTEFFNAGNAAVGREVMAA